MKITILNLIAIPIAILALGLQVSSQDVKDSKDHPLITRFPGSSILAYEARETEEHRFIKKRVVAIVADTDVLLVTGKVTKIVYQVGERSTIEVFGNYRDALAAANFKMLFECSGDRCGTQKLYTGSEGKAVSYTESDQRYLLAQAARSTGSVYVSVYVTRGKEFYFEGPNVKYRGDKVYTILNIVETKPVETGLITVNASSMLQAIRDTGRIALYSIYFDTGKAEIKPGSEPTIREIANLLTSNSALKLIVVGHTDNVGDFEFNTDLSLKRAEAVTRTLVTQYRISPTRLRAAGVGFAAPVATNKTEEGRAESPRGID